MRTLLLLSSAIVTAGTAAFWLAGASQSQWTWAPERSVRAKPEKSRMVIRVLGYVEPISEIRRLTFKADGLIESCPVRVGQSVEAGDVLARLHCRDELAAVGVAEQELAVAIAESGKLLSGVHPKLIAAAERRQARHRERVHYSRQQLDRLTRLYERQVATLEEHDLAQTTLHQSEEDLNEATAALEELKTHVRPDDKALAEAKIELARANLQAARERLRDTILTAPIRGTVLEIMKREGEAVRAFDSQPMIVFADLTQMRVRAEVDERYVDLIHVGQRATVYGRSLGDRRYPAKLALIKTLMGNKTVFSREAGERKDLDVLQAFVQPDAPVTVPIGLQVEVDIHLFPRTALPGPSS
jgi:multidrug resistance efflux pump